MPELGEPVAIGVIDEDKWECPFTHEKPGKVDNDISNDAAKLATRVRNGYSTQLWADEGGKIVPKTDQKLAPPVDETKDCPEGTVEFDGDSYPYSISAHHLIPGNASLPNSDIIDFVKKGPKIWGDIGYDINGAENGLWLPTHAALSAAMKAGRKLADMDKSMKYSTLGKASDAAGEANPDVGTFHQQYTYQVMKKTGRQFHDAHPDYSSEVVKELNKIAVKLLNVSGYHCDKCKDAKKVNGKLPPPHPLVLRLNALSRRMAGFLWGNPLRWKPPLFTSRFAASMAVDAKIWQQHGI